MGECRLAGSRGSSDPHGLTKGIAADFQDAQPVDLAYACAVHIHEQGSFLNHFADARLDEIVALHFRGQGAAKRITTPQLRGNPWSARRTVAAPCLRKWSATISSRRASAK